MGEKPDWLESVEAAQPSRSSEFGTGFDHRAVQRFNIRNYNEWLFQGRFRECLDETNGLVRQGCKEYACYLLRSGLKLMLGDCEGGWQDLMRAFQLSPRFMAEYAEGEVLFRRRKGDRRALFLEAAHGVPAPVLVRQLDAVLQSHPYLSVAYAWRGALKRRLLDYQGAAADLTRAWELGVRTSMILTWRGEARLQTGDTGGLQDMARALRLPSCAAWNWAWLGRAYVAFRRSPKALKYLDRAIELDPVNGWYYAWRGEAKRILRLPKGMLEDFDRALVMDPGYNYRGWVLTWRGLACLALGRPAEALENFNQALERMPDYALGYHGRAQAFRKLGRLREWILDFDRAARLDSKYIQAQYSRSCQELEAFVTDLGLVLKGQPDLAIAYQWRGLFHSLLGRAPAALMDFERAIDLDARQAWTFLWRGQLWYSMRESRKALVDFDRALGLEPKNPIALSWRARISVEQGRLPEALALLDRAVAADQRYAWLYADRGRVRLMIGRQADSIQDFERALSLDRGYVLAYVDLALARGLTDDPEQERAAVEHAARLDPSRTRQRLETWRSYWLRQGLNLTPGCRRMLQALERGGSRPSLPQRFRRNPKESDHETESPRTAGA